MMRMIKPPGRIEGGAVSLDDTDLSGLADEEMRRLRSAGIALVPQGAMNSLNPVMRIGDQIVDALADHWRTPVADRDCSAPHADAAVRTVGLQPRRRRTCTRTSSAAA